VKLFNLPYANAEFENAVGTVVTIDNPKAFGKAAKILVKVSSPSDGQARRKFVCYNWQVYFNSRLPPGRGRSKDSKMLPHGMCMISKDLGDLLLQFQTPDMCNLALKIYQDCGAGTAFYVRLMDDLLMGTGNLQWAIQLAANSPDNVLRTARTIQQLILQCSFQPENKPHPKLVLRHQPENKPHPKLVLRHQPENKPHPKLVLRHWLSAGWGCQILYARIQQPWCQWLRTTV
jgi:hypothetical protein